MAPSTTPRPTPTLRSLVGDALDALVPRRCPACDIARTGRERRPLCGTCHDALLPPSSHARPAAFAFGGPLADAVRRAKFTPDESAGRALAALFAEAAAGAVPIEIDAITFIPTPIRRRITRGFGLPAVLADALAAALERPVVEALALTREDAPLSAGADREARQAGVRGRFVTTAAARGRLLLVDDVVTTGATIDEATRVLVEAGVEVSALALAAVD